MTGHSLILAANHGKIWVDMEYRVHIDTSDGISWYRCKQATIVKERIVWELDASSRYNLHGAYEKKPHHELIKANDDEKLLNFTRRWGPFALELRMTQGSSPLEFVRQQRHELLVWTRLFAAIENKSRNPEPDCSRPWTSLRQCLIEVFRLNASGLAIPICGRFGVTPDAMFGEIETCLGRASDNEIAWVCDLVVRSYPVPPLGDALVIERLRAEKHVRATPLFLGLRDALNGMILQDIRSRRPYSYCAECGRLIKSQTRHERRFCDITVRPCARRWTDRKWKKDHPTRRNKKVARTKESAKKGKKS
jgi:hypothetical protein